MIDGQRKYCPDCLNELIPGFHLESYCSAGCEDLPYSRIWVHSLNFEVQHGQWVTIQSSIVFLSDPHDPEYYELWVSRDQIFWVQSGEQIVLPGTVLYPAKPVIVLED